MNDDGGKTRRSYLERYGHAIELWEQIATIVADNIDPEPGDIPDMAALVDRLEETLFEFKFTQKHKRQRRI